MPNEMSLDESAGNDQQLDDTGTGYIQEMKSLFDQYGSFVLYVYMYVCMYACMYTWYICMYVCMYTWYICMYVCMYVCIHGTYVCIYDVCMYTWYICMLRVPDRYAYIY